MTTIQYSVRRQEVSPIIYIKLICLFEVPIHYATLFTFGCSTFNADSNDGLSERNQGISCGLICLSLQCIVSGRGKSPEYALYAAVRLRIHAT